MKPVSIPDWYECDERFMAAHHQPALLIDLLRAMDISSHHILRGTGLFLEDVLAGEKQISQQQFAQLIRNACKLSRDPGLSFRWGAQLWPGHYGAFSHLLANAANLEDALETLVQYRHQLCPLLSPRLVQDDRYCYVQWLDVAGLGPQEHRFVVEAMTAGLISLARWLGKQKFPWRCIFSYPAPEYLEQYQVNLGQADGFGIGVDALMIERVWLRQTWPGGTQVAARIAQRECQQLTLACADHSFLELVYRILQRHVRNPLALSEVAEQLGMSSATFKRKLRKHNRQFQGMQDQVRFHTSVYLIHINGWSNEQIAEYLAFSDSNNFRRAFKRWAGITPSDSRSMVLL
ncbi:MAG: AraC family transcriptional regulator [Oceanobacter sp.]